MTMPRAVRFVLTYALIGLLAAVGVLWFFPGLLGLSPEPNRTVAIQQAPEQGETREIRSVRQAGPVSYADAVETAAPSVVSIFTVRGTNAGNPLGDAPMFREFFDDGPAPGPGGPDTNLGSGVIVSDQGYLLTNHHVIDDADLINVALNDGRYAEARVIGTDPDTDLAVLQIDLEDLPVITLGRSDELRVGDVVLAIGNPFGVGQTVTKGIVSATGRSQLGLSTFENFIQTDAAINPGNSGGALINAHGDVVGINTAMFSGSGGSQGIGFAIPAQLVSTVLEDLLEKGRVVRGWVGIEVQELTAALAESFELEPGGGVVVAGVMRDGPAEEAGLQPGDIIVALEGQRVSTTQELLMRVTERRPGDMVEVRVNRSGEREVFDIMIKERPATRELNNG